MTFTPCTTTVTANCTKGQNFVGSAAPLGYQVTDSFNRVVSSTYVASVAGMPSANPDAQTGAFDTNQTYSPASNDVAGAGTSMVASTVRLCPLVATAPFGSGNCTATTVTTADGVYSLDTATGVVTFDPASGFVGVATVPVNYVVADGLGQEASSTITPTVSPSRPPVMPVSPVSPVPPPTASPDSSHGARGVPQTIVLITNDRPGSSTLSLVPSSIRLCGPTETAPLCTVTELVVPGQGVFLVNPNGSITFTPDPNFEGPATPQRYVVTDERGLSASSTVSTTVVASPAPVTRDDVKNGPADRPIVFDPLVNDAPGDVPSGDTGSVNLVRSSLRLCEMQESVPNCTATELITADGTYTVDVATGWVVFTPRRGFRGIATQPVTYQVANDWGGTGGVRITSAVITPIIDPDPVGPPTLPITGRDTNDPTGVALVVIAIGVVAITAARRNPRRT